MRLRLFLSFALIVLVAVSSMALIAHGSAVGEVRAFMFRGGMYGLEELVESLEEYYGENHSWSDVDSLLASSTHGQGMGQGMGPGMGQGMGQGMGAGMNQRLILTDPQGKVLVDTQGGSAAGQLDRSQLRESIELQDSGEVIGYLFAEGGMGYTPGDETFLVSRISSAALTASLIAGGISLLLALILAYGLLRPVRELNLAANKMAQGDLSQRVRVRGNDELAGLGRTFNHMAESLQRAEESRRAMTADIAHELRNPLAVQRANLEAMQDGIYPLSPENLEAILEQNQMLTRLVNDLRTLALADAGQLELEFTPTDFPALVKRVVDRSTPQAATHQVQIELESAWEERAGIPLLSIDPLRTEQILGNLISNALRYTPAGGRVRLGLQQIPGAIQLTVHDSGPGIPPQSLPYIFDRFYRAEKSRTRAEGGSGLGLAIARQLAQAHGGDLSAANHPQGGATFTLTLPA